MKTQTVNLGKKGSFNVHKGALHRALGVPQGEKIPASKLASASNSSDAHVLRMAASAKGFKAMSHGKKKRKSGSRAFNHALVHRLI